MPIIRKQKEATMLHTNKLPAWNLLFFYFPVSTQKLRAGYCHHGGSPSPTKGATLCFPHILVTTQVRGFPEQKDFTLTA